MENPSEPFIFSAQQQPNCNMNVESSEGLDTSMNVEPVKGLDASMNMEASYTAKRARADNEVLGRNDVSSNYMRENDIDDRTIRV